MSEKYMRSLKGSHGYIEYSLNGYNRRRRTLIVTVKKGRTSLTKKCLANLYMVLLGTTLSSALVSIYNAPWELTEVMFLSHIYQAMG